MKPTGLTRPQAARMADYDDKKQIVAERTIELARNRIKYPSSTVQADMS